MRFIDHARKSCEISPPSWIWRILKEYLLETSKVAHPNPGIELGHLPALIRRCGGCCSPKAKLPLPKPGAMRPALGPSYIPLLLLQAKTSQWEQSDLFFFFGKHVLLWVNECSLLGPMVDHHCKGYSILCEWVFLSTVSVPWSHFNTVIAWQWLVNAASRDGCCQCFSSILWRWQI